MSVLGRLQSQAGIESDGDFVNIPGLNTNLGLGKTFYLDATNGAATGSGRTPLAALSTLPLAYAKLTTGMNDKIGLVAGATQINLAAALDWAMNCSHLYGIGSFGRANQRSRVGHSANFSPMLTVSGYGNSFQDIFFAHGRGNAGNLIAVDVTGPRNSFLSCHFGGPFHATEAGTAGYRLVKLENSETYFRDCIFGQDSIARTAANSMVEFGGQADPPRSIFENCLFLSIVSAAGGAGSTFLKVAAGAGAGLALFRNCTFINIGGTAMTLGIDGTGLGNFRMHFSNSTFAGCTDIAAAAYEGYITFDAVNFNTGANEDNGLAVNYDHTA